MHQAFFLKKIRQHFDLDLFFAIMSYSLDLDFVWAIYSQGQPELHSGVHVQWALCVVSATSFKVHLNSCADTVGFPEYKDLKFFFLSMKYILKWFPILHPFLLTLYTKTDKHTSTLRRYPKKRAHSYIFALRDIKVKLISSRSAYLLLRSMFFQISLLICARAKVCMECVNSKRRTANLKH